MSLRTGMPVVNLQLDPLSTHGAYKRCFRSKKRKAYPGYTQRRYLVVLHSG
jgi:hypothetical protein